MDIEMQNHQHQQQQMNEFQAMLDAATAAASSSNSNSINESGQGQQDGYDPTAMQANLLQQQVCDMPYTFLSFHWLNSPAFPSPFADGYSSNTSTCSRQ
jgi:hypothetical protein